MSSLVSKGGKEGDKRGDTALDGTAGAGNERRPLPPTREAPALSRCQMAACYVSGDNSY